MLQKHRVARCPKVQGHIDYESFLRYPFQEEAGAEDKAGAGDAPKMYTAEEVRALIEKEVAGLKANQEAPLARKRKLLAGLKKPKKNGNAPTRKP